MASSYSTDLKIELMETGQNSGTWGEKTNTNWNLIQQAVAGFQALALTSTNTSLVMTNATISNARNMVLEFTARGKFTTTYPKKEWEDANPLPMEIMVDNRNVTISNDGVLINRQREEEKQNQIALAFTECSICMEDISVCQGQCIRQLGESPQQASQLVKPYSILSSMRTPITNEEYLFCSESLDVLNLQEKDKEDTRKWRAANQIVEDNKKGFRVYGTSGDLDRRYVCDTFLVL